MVFDGVAVLTNQEARRTAQINFSDGSKAFVHPKLKVMHVTAPNGISCNLKSKDGSAYHHALCGDDEAAKQFEDITGHHPVKLLGKPQYDHDGTVPAIESVHVVDRYV